MDIEVYGDLQKKKILYGKMYEVEPRGAFIQFLKAISSRLTSRIKNLEELSLKWGEPNNAAIINFLGYHYRNGDKENQKKLLKNTLIFILRDTIL